MNDFYDKLASQYAELTGEAGRVEPARRFVDEVMRRVGPASVLDVACGTGLYAVEFARRGVRTVGADPSAGMLEQARARARKAGVSVAWVQCPMQAIADRVDGPFEGIVCLGNSVPHVLDEAGLDGTMAGFRRLLAPGAPAMIQLLNYRRVLERNERIVGIDRHDKVEYVRFYDFIDPLLRFNVLEVRGSGDRPEHRLHETTLRPWTDRQLTAALKKTGFTDVQGFGGLDFSPLDDASDTVMILGR